MSTGDSSRILPYQPLTNGACWTRTLKPLALMCVHITGNPNLPCAENEWEYANRPDSGGPSAHDYIDRDGSGIEALDPALVCAWSNGDVQSPDMSNPGVARIVASGQNANRVVYREVECVGYPGTAPVTDAQLDTVARLIAADSRATGLRIDRTTVLTHADLNSVSRPSCAFTPDIREARMTALIAKACAYAAPPEVPMRQFTVIASTPGQVTAKGDAGTAIVAFDGGRSILCVGATLPTSCRVRLAVGYPGTTDTDGYLVALNGRSGVLLDRNVATFDPAPDPLAAKISAALAALQS